jgi:uncharacterized protein YcbK (DUF882 family)
MSILKLVKGANIRLSQNFSSGEFDCKCINPDCQETLIDTELVEKLQSLRDTLGIPLYINSAYRCLKHNAAIRGSRDSQHMLGKAVDISVRNRVSHSTIIFRAGLAGFTGLGEYPTFVHLDVREGGNARW